MQAHAAGLEQQISTLTAGSVTKKKVKFIERKEIQNAGKDNAAP